MIYFVALLPATALTVAGYFVLFLANRSEGALRTFGKYLGFWAFTLAALVVLGAIFAAAHGRHHGGMMGERGMYGHMHGFCPGEPRFFGPHGDEFHNNGRPGDGPGGPAPQAPTGGANPPAPPGPASPATH
jgi:hypothetical protein